VDVFKDNQRLRTITKLDYFGERALVFNTFRTATVIAIGDVQCWVLNKDHFFEIIEESIHNQLMQKIEY
jgi:CRP-like cAMP-binding protein